MQVRTTDYGGGGGGAPDGDDDGEGSGTAFGIGGKIAMALASPVGVPLKELRTVASTKGRGLMSFVGGFRDFCAEKRALGVGACAVRSDSSIKAFRAPASTR